MKNDNLKVEAHLHEKGCCDLYCSECGHLAHVPGLFREQIALTHLAAHGCNVPALYKPCLN